jgi:hypothetical protein
VLVLAPSGGLFGKAVAEAGQARPWWPWLVAASVWLLVSGAISLAVSHHDSRHDSHHGAEHR